MSFIRLHVTAEGYTELNFVKKVLANHLGQFNIVADSRCVLTSRDKKLNYEYRGGLRRYDKVKNDIRNWLREDHASECRFTTMFDFYRLPSDFPGFDDAMRIQDKHSRVLRLEAAFREDIDDHRFFPYIQLHEFESLIFVDPSLLELEYFDRSGEIRALVQVSENAPDGNPELINDGDDTAPSKRILQEIPEYDKANIGPDVTACIGIQRIRETCPHFNEWLQQLERFAD